MDPHALIQQEVLHRIDRAFAAMIHRIDGQGDPLVDLAAGLVSRAAADGHVCLDLESIVNEGVQSPDGNRRISLNISLSRWRKALTRSLAVGSVGRKKPLILDGNILYLQRYWNYEQLVTQSILERCRCHIREGEIPNDEEMIPVGGIRQHQDPDQAKAVRTALSRRFIVISGGPGTGKTTTIARIITALRRLNTKSALRIMLAAPTGKAAARMQEALQQGMGHLLENQNANISNSPIEAKTLHRLLEILPGQYKSRYAPNCPLPGDVIIVDEASMIDLALMAKLVQAVPLEAKLILVGDKDQLSSVEAGSVMGDICAGVSAEASNIRRDISKVGPKADLSNHIVVLKKSYRFSAGSGIDDLGRAINAGNSGQVMALLNDPQKNRIDFKPVATFSDVEENLAQLTMEDIAPIFSEKDPIKALVQHERIKILTPLRKGPYGVASINQLVEATLRRNRVIASVPGRRADWYPGRPVIMNRNDYYHHLFNGDVGITIHERIGDMQQVRIGFPDGAGEIRYLVPEQLLDHETVFAMSVHKSQGTEFEKVVLILPDRDSPLLTRELIYTAATRARQRVEIWGRQEILHAAVERRIHRASGLRKKLWRLK